MKKEILFAAFLFAAVALSGCTQTAAEPEPVLKYVCYNGAIAENQSDCPGLPDVDCEESCPCLCSIPIPPEMTHEEFIQGQIDNANYCSVKEDCVLAERKCPFGCNILVNKNEVDKINRMIGEYKQTCNLTCASLRFYNCDLNKCVETDWG